jgi:hypothetical protein
MENAIGENYSQNDRYNLLFRWDDFDHLKLEKVSDVYKI